MSTVSVVGVVALGASRRRVYRQSKRVLTRLLAGRWKGPRWAQDLLLAFGTTCP